jgi:DNA-binding transcriptional ArsR family regulator
MLCIYTDMYIATLQTLADPTRLSILDFLRTGEHTVNDITDNVDIRQSGVSRHLRILHEAGFVQVRPHGQRRYYSLRPEPFRQIDEWLDGYRSFWEARLDKFGEALDQKRRARRSKYKETLK